jgi:hypothetical protein
LNTARFRKNFGLQADWPYYSGKKIWYMLGRKGRTERRGIWRGKFSSDF